MKDIEYLEKEIEKSIFQKKTIESLEILRVNIFGKKGVFKEKIKYLNSLSGEEKKVFGYKINNLKNKTKDLFKKRFIFLENEEILKKINKNSVDITLPIQKNPFEKGRIHPVSKTMNEIIDFFLNMGFEVIYGPEIESDYYNFTALNFTKYHPARDMHDTFFFVKNDHKLLRTHTSSVQIRTLENRTPPLRVIAPGKVYRIDLDPTHSPMFHQIEGFMIDKKVNVSNMIWLLKKFCKTFFNISSHKIRFRSSFFPFTEPSMEVDIQYNFSNYNRKIKEKKQWLEILGCGMIHPNVLNICKIDAKKYQGFAWGMGVDRMTMLKYKIPDLRSFFNSDIRWINHYGFRPLEGKFL